MARDQRALRKIAEQLQRVIDALHPGAGMVLLVFDSRVPNTNVSICLHGIDEGPAVRLLREKADLIAGVAPKDLGPLIIPPPNSFRSS